MCNAGYCTNSAKKYGRLCCIPFMHYHNSGICLRGYNKYKGFHKSNNEVNKYVNNTFQIKV